MRLYEDPRQDFNELAGRIYAALREGGLDAELVVELACLLEEWDCRTPAVREVLERPSAYLTAADVTRLGRRLLDDIHFEPTFALEPGWWVALEQALEVVARDARATGVTGTLRLVIPDWDDNGHARVEYEGCWHGNGIWPSEGRDAQRALARIADAAQESIMEMIWAVWPVCPLHNLGLNADMEQGTAVWRCAGAGDHILAPVGELPPQRRQGPAAQRRR